MQIRAKIRLGAVVEQDYRRLEWAISDVLRDIVFTCTSPAEQMFGVFGWFTCSAPGYGERHNYGNGQLFVRVEDLIPESTDAIPLYPCSWCGKLRTAAEGGTTFTVCDTCWETGCFRSALTGRS